MSAPEEVADAAAAARRFRAAIESTRISMVSFESFPRGACGDASEMLGQYMTDCGLGVWAYVMAFAPGPELSSHGWIEQEGTIVDITADQFAGRDGFGNPLPVVVTRDRTWHDHHFPQQTRNRQAGLAFWAGPAQDEVATAYAHLRQAANRDDSS